MRSRFDQQLALLNQEMIEMGALCEEAIATAAKALTEGSRDLAAKVAPLERDIDQKERDIESRCLKLLLQQQPVARDLRQISAALKMVTDMERIGDQAEDIAEIAVHLEGCAAECGHIREMAENTIHMVTESVDAYVKRDVALARNVIAYDDVVDGCFDREKRRLTVGRITPWRTRRSCWAGPMRRRRSGSPAARSTGRRAMRLSWAVCIRQSCTASR